MEIIEMLLGNLKKNKRRESNELSGMVGRFSKGIMGCSCLLVAALIGGIVLLLGGIISTGQDPMTIIIVIATIIVALASLIRTSLGY